VPKAAFETPTQNTANTATGELRHKLRMLRLTEANGAGVLVELTAVGTNAMQ
tara:strand:- start:50 stop:205 length:156 start_codon:yes stop_codon:yes gene_type:complete